MKQSHHPEAPARRRAASLLVAAAGLLCALPAGATLGGNLASVEADRLELHATVVHNNRASFTVHELTLANKGVVREYAAPDGAVFAVTWHGPSMPNLRQLLGAHFDEIGQASERQRGGLGHFAARTDSVSFSNNGRMRSFHGSAVLYKNLPIGVASDDIQ